MNRLQLLRTLHRHVRLSERRSVSWEENRTAMILIYIMASFGLLYLVFIAIMLSMLVNSMHDIEGFRFMYGILPFLMVFDFMLRFGLQNTPSQLAQPYRLLPISKYACTDSFLITSLFMPFNAFWLCLFVPYAIMSVVFVEGFWAFLGFLIGLQLLVFINSLWYLLVRSLVNTDMRWWLLPLAVYGAVALPFFVGSDAGIVSFCEFYSRLGEPLTFWNPLAYAAVLALLAALFAVNRKVQLWLVDREIEKKEEGKKGFVFSISFLENRGVTGAYIMLELKSILRNKNIRKTFISGTLIVVLFSLMLAFTDIYDGNITTNFWCIYCFAVYGAMILIKVMCYEGNYIDALMVRKENILLLLRAKYYLHSVLLIFPFILMIPTVIMGKCTWIMLVSYMLFTAGFIYFLYMQMAVYNKKTIPLNTKFVGKGSMENSNMQVLLELLVLVVPLLFVQLLEYACGRTASHVIVGVFGLAFIVTHRLWLRNIYGRMMRRRYENMESFRSTR